MNDQDQRLRDHYQNLTMSQEKLDQLLAATAAADAVITQQNKRQMMASAIRNFVVPGKQWASWVGVGLACGLILALSMGMYNSVADNKRTEHTLREVALNHTTRLEPEFRGSSLANLDNSMHQLPFALVLPKSITSEYELIGSRYCSLSGVLAAHVKLHDKKSGKPMSLFVASNADELEEIPPQQTILEGVEVQFWREGGLFFALAQRS